MTLTAETLFRSLADQTRLRCLALIQQHGKLCVCELTYALELVQPKISRHLALLREAGVIQDQRAGRWVYYRLHPDLPEWVLEVISTSTRAIAHTAPYRDDARMLDAMPNRPAGLCCA